MTVGTEGRQASRCEHWKVLRNISLPRWAGLIYRTHESNTQVSHLTSTSSGCGVEWAPELIWMNAHTGNLQLKSLKYTVLYHKNKDSTVLWHATKAHGGAET
jgi:hypothetical protein